MSNQSGAGDDGGVVVEWHSAPVRLPSPAYQQIFFTGRMPFVLADFLLNQGLKWVGTPFQGLPFLKSGVSGPKRALFRWQRTFRSRKDSFWCLRLVGRNVNGIIAADIIQWTSQSDFDQDNGLTRKRWGLLQNWKGPHIQGHTVFYGSHNLKISVLNPVLHSTIKALKMMMACMAVKTGYWCTAKDFRLTLWHCRMQDLIPTIPNISHTDLWGN